MTASIEEIANRQLREAFDPLYPMGRVPVVYQVSEELKAATRALLPQVSQQMFEYVTRQSTLELYMLMAAMRRQSETDLSRWADDGGRA